MTEESEEKNWRQLSNQLGRIEARLAKLEEAEDARQERRDADRTRCAENHANDIAMSRMVQDHQRTLHGNGRPGLIARHQTLETRADTVERLLKFQIGLLVPMVVGGFGTAAYLIVELS